MIQPYKITALRMGILKSVDYSQIVYLQQMGSSGFRFSRLDGASAGAKCKYFN